MAARSETERIAVARQRRTTPQQRLPWGSIAKHGILISTCGVILFPLAWVLLLSVKSLPDAYTNRIWPHHFDFGSYHRALTAIDTLPQNFENSIVVTVATMVITTTIAVLAGYGAARSVERIESIRARRAVLVGLGALMLAEYASMPIALQPCRVFAGTSAPACASG